MSVCANCNTYTLSIYLQTYLWSLCTYVYFKIPSSLFVHIITLLSAPPEANRFPANERTTLRNISLLQNLFQMATPSCLNNSKTIQIEINNHLPIKTHSQISHQGYTFLLLKLYLRKKTPNYWNTIYKSHDCRYLNTIFSKWDTIHSVPVTF